MNKDRETLIDRALKLASKGSQSDDGYAYVVPARDLADYADTIRELVEELRSSHPVEAKMSNSAQPLHKEDRVVDDKAREALFPDYEWAWACINCGLCYVNATLHSEHCPEKWKDN